MNSDQKVLFFLFALMKRHFGKKDDGDLHDGGNREKEDEAVAEEIIKGIRHSPSQNRGKNQIHPGVVAEKDIEKESGEGEAGQDEQIDPDLRGFVIDIGDRAQKDGNENRGDETKRKNINAFDHDLFFLLFNVR